MDRPPGMVAACGLDFGTSNTTLGVPSGEGARLLPLEGGEPTLPSAIFFGVDADARLLVGRAAVGAYREGWSGRFMRSLKSILGSPTMEEQTLLHGRRAPFSEVIRLYVGAAKRRAEEALGAPLEAVVHGRPVRFVDDDPAADARAEEALRAIAAAVGFRHVSFQLEPIAAASDFETRIDRELLALVADLGGGTADFTVARLRPAERARDDRAGDVLATGGVRIGGTDYDAALSMDGLTPLFGYGSRMRRGDVDAPSSPYWDLSTWSSVNALYETKAIAEIRAIRREAAEPRLLDRLLRVIETRRAHDVLTAAEAAKIALSDEETTLVDLAFAEPGLCATMTRGGFEAASRRLSERLGAAAARCVREAGVAPERIAAVFFTGGTSSIPSVRRAIMGAAPDARAVDGDRYGSVGLGLAIEARRRYG